ncbi:MAG: o-succinylbenzoate synthase [Flavobacteriia bacterium]|jgi:o-succinylbenzoate synthase
MQVHIQHLPLIFKRPVGTSRGVMNVKNSWVIEVQHDNFKGKGEISIIEGLSPEYVSFAQFEQTIHEASDFFESCFSDEHPKRNLPLAFRERYLLYPSIIFAFECALLNLFHGGTDLLFDNSFSRGNRAIPINGLVWMGDETFMQEQIEEKIYQGFTTIKMKVGAIDFSTELKILTSIRKKYSKNEITLRVDANGAFSANEADSILEKLESLDLHSIEQPIQPGQWDKMRNLCLNSTLKIALDEELIGIHTKEEKIKLLEYIRPPFIILKPSLHGGISGTQEWILLAEERGIAWWMTSALESNIGLNAICQLAGEYNNELPQGLGTGSLYENNTPTKLIVEKGFIIINTQHYSNK